MEKAKNPILWTDLPDLDVIRVADTYYMISTTMHMLPGGMILESKDLLHWQIASYVFDVLDETRAQKLEDGKAIYGKGMWAASLRWNKGIFYICFACNDTEKTYLYQATDIHGPWKKQEMEGFYHDASLLFEEDHTYIVYGNRQIYLTELKEDLTGPKENGLQRCILEDSEEYMLGFEGAHIYKIKDRYYVFLIHWPKNGSKRRVEACYSSASLEGEFIGGDVLDDDMGYCNSGVAQGGIVDTPDGKWYAMLFQDHGAVGRVPVLVPVQWKDDMPVFGINQKVPLYFEQKELETKQDPRRALITDDDFKEDRLRLAWQWNHQPQENGWSLTERKGALRIRPLNCVKNVVQAQNTLTQRTFGPKSEAEITIDASNLLKGDYAGISAFQSQYAMIAITRSEKGFDLVQIKRSQIKAMSKGFGMGDLDTEEGQICERIAISEPKVTLKVRCDFTEGKDIATCYYRKNGQWVQMKEQIKMLYTLDHFMGYRFALSCFSTEQIGGYADFKAFRIRVLD